MAGQRQQACRGLFGSARLAQYQREERRGKGVENRVSTDFVASGLIAHQRHETGQVVRSRPYRRFTMTLHGPDNYVRGQVIANQPIMRRPDEKSPTQHVQTLALAV